MRDKPYLLAVLAFVALAAIAITNDYLFSKLGLILSISIFMFGVAMFCGINTVMCLKKGYHERYGVRTTHASNPRKFWGFVLYPAILGLAFFVGGIFIILKELE